ncbi:MAG: membrane protein insertion efficiency factor YidD [Actinomycetota bacterium]|nr:membrane protein insertion efficiency factor YidD [Actinomycetota bacterium]
MSSTPSLLPHDPMKIPSEQGILVRGLLATVRGYQHLAAGRPSPCRYVPSCSNYARDAVERHGAGRGSWMALRRICRCHPWGSHGWDPVPESTPVSTRGSA